MDTRLPDQLAENDPSAISMASGYVAARNLSKNELSQVWNGTILGILRYPGSKGLISLCMGLIELKQEPESRDMYENLFSMIAFAKTTQAYIPTIRTGAAIARLTNGEVPPGMDSEGFMKLAKQAFLRAVEEGHESCKVYAIEALRHMKDYEVRNVLTGIARNSDISELKAAAGDSIGHMRKISELEQAKADLEFLIEIEYADPTSPQPMYIEQIFQAVETALRIRKEDEETPNVAVSLVKLNAYSGKPSQIDELFPSKNDRDNLKRVDRNVENALLHALTDGNPAQKSRAAEGLVKLGSDRVEQILDSIVKREGEGTGTGAIASEALSRIRGDKTEVFFLPHIKPPQHVKSASAAVPRKLTPQ
jgi:hypothetical protein